MRGVNNPRADGAVREAVQRKDVEQPRRGKPLGPPCVVGEPQQHEEHTPSERRLVWILANVAAPRAEAVLARPKTQVRFEEGAEHGLCLGSGDGGPKSCVVEVEQD